ncbi:RNA-directed DNA polymerase from mobile element jockey [Trichonephila clavipes]|nr:RNA-directed DNA polymerase from mobile element jockey [Trichonephila clavipes]
MTKGFKKKRSPISALKGNTGIAYTDEEKAETLANSLESQFQLNNISNPTQDNNHIRLVTRFFNNENNFDDSPSIAKPSEIVQIINNFKIKKAPGREGITNKMCKHFNRSVVFQLTNIINNILTVGYFPKMWKTASVIPILKPGKDPTLPDSFRPISLLPVLSKITEKVIQKRLCQHLNDNDILIPQQHGFRAGLSTSHQLLRVVEYIKTGFRDRKSTGAVFLDIQKAFDRVWHVGLLYKLIKINTPPHLIKLISSFLTNRSFAVKVNNIHSTNRKINAGTPQGSSISPILFNIYVNDIPRTSQSTICMFADDTAILAQSNELQLVTHFLHKHIAKLEDWFSTWKIALNVAKTEAVFFSHHIKKEPPKLYLHNTHVPWSKSTKYLGVTLDKRLTFKQHIIQIRRNFNISVAKVFPLIARKSCLSLRNKMLIYKLVLRPILQYASPIWGHAAYSNIKMLESAQNKIIKIITDSPCRKYEPQVNAGRKFSLFEIYDLDIFVCCHSFAVQLATTMKRGEQPCSSAGLRRRSVVLLLLCVVMVTGQVMNYDPKCLATGGMCVEEHRCPVQSRATEDGVCQGGRTPGVCCYVTPSDANCQQRGGRCGNYNECANVQVFGQLDCPEGTECCLLIY